jgi:hypothetical protein
MKTSKIMISIMVAFMFVFFSSNVFAQTDAENHATLTSHHQAIMKRATAIASGEAKTLNDQITNANEARRSLADAKKAHSQLKKVIPAKLISEAIVHHDNIDRFHATATTHANAILTELNNMTPDDAKLKESARKLNSAIDLAEKEHQELIKETK